MNQRISEPVTVAMVFHHEKHEIAPVKVSWHGRIYRVTKVGLHHTFREGRTLIHVFSVLCDNTFMRLTLNTERLSWKLEEVAEGI